MRINTFANIDICTFNGTGYPKLEPGVFDIPVEVALRLLEAFPQKFWLQAQTEVE